MSLERAKRIAEPHLADPNNKLVFVGDNGVVKCNEDPFQMQTFFKAIRQEYWVFEQPKKTTKK